MQEWIDDEKHMWLRRTRDHLSAQAQGETDEDMLFDFCLRRSHEKEFFIRKAIGWALRQYSKFDPAAWRRSW